MNGNSSSPSVPSGSSGNSDREQKHNVITAKAAAAERDSYLDIAGFRKQKSVNRKFFAGLAVRLTDYRQILESDVQLASHRYVRIIFVGDAQQD
jgi:hypothetical protein